MLFAVVKEISVIFLPCPSMSGCKNVTRAAKSSFAPISEIELTTGAGVRVAMGGHRVKSVAISDCLEFTHNYLLVFLPKQYVIIEYHPSRLKRTY